MGCCASPESKNRSPEPVPLPTSAFVYGDQPSAPVKQLPQGPAPQHPPPKQQGQIMQGQYAVQQGYAVPVAPAIVANHHIPMQPVPMQPNPIQPSQNRRTMQTAHGTTLQVPPLIPQAQWMCDFGHNFIDGANYHQRDLCSPAISGSRVYGEGGDVIKWCIDNSPKDAVGFFYQMHTNGHEIVGYYCGAEASMLINGPRVQHGHYQGAICFRQIQHILRQFRKVDLN